MFALTLLLWSAAGIALVGLLRRRRVRVQTSWDW